ncbi:MAG TPA: hypothetical protein VJV78_11035 [Polyangiales bacterium]|nr:hypothetical protein [Polyangiales bacterium]
MDATEATALVDAAISVIVAATFASVRAAAGGAFRRFISGLVYVFVTIARATIAACLTAQVR